MYLHDPNGRKVLSGDHIILDGTEQAIITTSRMLSRQIVEAIRKRVEAFIQGDVSLLVLEDNMEIMFVGRTKSVEDLTAEQIYDLHIEEIGWNTIDEFTEECLRSR